MNHFPTLSHSGHLFPHFWVLEDIHRLEDLANPRSWRQFMFSWPPEIQVLQRDRFMVLQEDRVSLNEWRVSTLTKKLNFRKQINRGKRIYPHLVWFPEKYFSRNVHNSFDLSVFPFISTRRLQ